MDHPLAPRPLRADLLLRRRATAAGVDWVVKDPERRCFFRLREVEHFVASQLDGRTTVPELQTRVEERFRARLDRAVLERFLAMLAAQGLLEPEGDGRARATGRPGHAGRISGGLLSLRVRVCDPDPWLGSLAAAARPIFSWPFVALALAFVALATATAIGGRAEMLRELGRVHGTEGLAVAWVTLLVATALHELSHAVACKRYGGEVRELGFLLIYLNPAFYCDVSDAWLFPARSRRLIVGFAGVAFDVLTWAAATLLWRVTVPGCGLRRAALIVSLISIAKALLNLNPLIRLDGYYILSDALEIPNLRPRAFAFLRELAGRSGAAPSRPVTARERRVFLVYGLLALVYSVALLASLGFALGGWAAARLGATPGALLGVGAVAFLVRRSRSMTVPTVGVPGTPNRRFARAAGATLASALGVTLLLGRIELVVTGPFEIVPRQQALVRAGTAGVLEEVLVAEGSRVARDQVVARTRTADLRATGDALDAEIGAAAARLALLEAGPRPEEVAVAETQARAAGARHEASVRAVAEAEGRSAARAARERSRLRAANARAAAASAETTRLRALSEASVAPRAKLAESLESEAVREAERDAAEAELAIAESECGVADTRLALEHARGELDEAVARLALLRAGARGEEVRAARATLEGLRAQRREVERRLALAEVRSPIAGVVVTPSSRLRDLRGQRLGEGDPIVLVADASELLARVAVDEADLADLTPLAPVELRARVDPLATFAGELAALPPAVLAEDEAGVRDASASRRAVEPRRAEVLVVLRDPPPGLKPAMTGTAKLLCGPRRPGTLILRRVAATFGIDLWSRL